jgi:glycosyltransferase involved in cell wall biosynthesis
MPGLKHCIFFMEGGAFLPMMIAKVFRKRIIWVLPSNISPQDKDDEDILQKPGYVLKKISRSLADQIIVYSPTLIRDWGLESYEKKISIAHEHFLDFNQFKASGKAKKSRIIVGYIGRFSEEKGALNYVQAIPHILRMRNGIYFLMGGEGRLRQEIQRFLDEHGLRDKVDLCGWIRHDNLPEYLNTLTLFVLPSFTEGLPNTMLEAMACGTPVLATSVGSIPDVITDGHSGFIMTGNTPESIAKSVLRALDHPALEQIAQNGQSLVENEFTFDKAVRRYRNVLNKTT